MNSGTTARRASAHSRNEQIVVGDILKTVDNKESQSAKNVSLEAIKIAVEFKLSANEAKSVAVAGSFNQWSTKKTPLRKEGECWTTTLKLPRGRYEYRFVVDGQWVSDPNAKESVANPFGGSNSVLGL
jgi:1,4-alpha-glucan branching enzyme